MKGLRLLWFVVAAVGFILTLGPAAGAAEKQKMGFIQNDEGQKCWYRQRMDRQQHYFHSELRGDVSTIVFDDPRCMKSSALGLDVNKMLINNVITGWYGNSKARFKTRVEELEAFSSFQSRGVCIRSNYEMLGVMVDYIIEDNSIAAVKHGIAAAGCGR